MINRSNGPNGPTRLNRLNRRALVQGSLALGSLGVLSSLLGCATAGGIPAKARVVVVEIGRAHV